MSDLDDLDIELPSRCEVCGQVWPFDAPTPGAGDCSCIRCEDCGHVFAEGDTYCTKCNERFGEAADGILWAQVDLNTIASNH